MPPSLDDAGMVSFRRLNRDLQIRIIENQLEEIRNNRRDLIKSFEFFNQKSSQFSNILTILMKNAEETTQEISRNITDMDAVGDDAQLANIDLQNILQKQAQLILTLANVSKLLTDTGLAVIRNMGDSSAWSVFLQDIRGGQMQCDVSALVQYVMRESYLEKFNDLQNYAEHLKKFQEMKKATGSATGTFLTGNRKSMAFTPSEGLMKFMLRYISDPNFRAEMEKNPALAIKNSGLAVSEAEIAVLSKIPADELYLAFDGIPYITRPDVATAVSHSLDLLSKEEYQPTEGVRKFMELYTSDANFRSSFRTNPSRAISMSGLHIGKEEFMQLARIPVANLEKAFSTVQNISRRQIVMAISDGISVTGPVEPWPSRDMQKYILKYVSDPSFREAFSKNPESALKEAGLQISSEEFAYLSAQNLEDLKKTLSIIPGSTRMGLAAVASFSVYMK